MSQQVSFRQFLREMRSFLKKLWRRTEIKGLTELMVLGSTIYILPSHLGSFGLIVCIGLGGLFFIRFLYWTWRIAKEERL